MSRGAAVFAVSHVSAAASSARRTRSCANRDAVLSVPDHLDEQSQRARVSPPGSLCKREARAQFEPFGVFLESANTVGAAAASQRTAYALKRGHDFVESRAVAS